MRNLIAYKERIFLDIVIVLVIARGASSPEAVLTQVVVVAALTLVAKPGERLASAALASDRMINYTQHQSSVMLITSSLHLLETLEQECQE